MSALLAELFYWLVNMSIVGSVAGIVVVLVRLIWRIPRRVIVWLWAIPFCRLIVPFGVGGRFGFMALIGRFFSKTVPISLESASLSATNVVQGAQSYFPLTYKSFLIATVFRVAAVIWLIIALLMLVLWMVQYAQTARMLRDARHLKGDIWLSPYIDSPLVFGVFRPRIVQPDHGENVDELVLLHERMHIRRLDNVWRLLAFITAAMHWFNPLVWWFLDLFLKDLEMACDECVLDACGEDQRKAYAATLLSAAQARHRFLSAFGGAPLRTRLSRILSYRKLSVLSLVACALLVGTMAYMLLTNAV